MQSRATSLMSSFSPTTGVVWLLDLAARTRRIIIGNMFISLGINLAILVVAMIGCANLRLAIAANTGA
jgi:cation transport ATPase